MLINVALYSRIIAAFSKDLDLGNDARRRHREQQRTLTKMVLVNSAVFFCFVLFHDVMIPLLIVLRQDGLHLYIYTFLTVIPTLLNCGVNPIIYNIFGSRYREAFINIFPCCALLRLCRRRDKKSAHLDVEIN